MGFISHRQTRAFSEIMNQLNSRTAPYSIFSFTLSVSLTPRLEDKFAMNFRQISLDTRECRTTISKFYYKERLINYDMTL